MSLSTVSRIALAFLLVGSLNPVRASDANRLAYLDESDPYYVSGGFAKLTTPQWVGEEGVAAVVVLAIDDMRDPAKYEAYLRPIIERLNKLEGGGGLSIMTNRVEPGDPRLAQWLKERVSIDIHTYDHPCPLLKDNNFAAAQATYERCVDLMREIPGNLPVAYRMPCCDSLNTVSPRFFSEIFNKRTAKGNFLTIDSSVFQVFTSADPALPRELVIDADGGEKFMKYTPSDRSFVNTIFNYPYPYVIGRLCWEFPCVAPSDWSAQHLHKPLNPRTVADWKAAVDATVLKQGCFNLVFHPHGWIRSEQVVELIEHCAQRHGKRVLFLSFREAQERLNRHLLAGQPLRSAEGHDGGVRLADVNDDGYLDVLIGNAQMQRTRLWSPKDARWIDGPLPVRFTQADGAGQPLDTGARFGVLDADRRAVLLAQAGEKVTAWHFDRDHWVEDNQMLVGLRIDDKPLALAFEGRDQGVRFRDLDGNGQCECIVSSGRQQAVFRWSPGRQWKQLPYALPEGTKFVDAEGRDAGLRLIDLDQDGDLDAIFSDHQRYSLHLFVSPEQGWSKQVQAGPQAADSPIPMIVRNGTNNGAWFHSKQLWVQNENTAKLKDLVDRRSFADLLQPGPKRISIEDLYRLDAPRWLALAPDGKQAAYVRQWIDPETKQERNSLWLAEGSREKTRPLEENQPDARAPVFSPDGRWIAFLSTRAHPEGWKQTPPVPRESDPSTDLWLLSTRGGRAIPLSAAEKPYGRVFNDGFYGRVAFSRDSRKLLFVADDGRDPRTPEELAADVIVVRPDQGEGYTGYGPAQLWVAELDEEPGLSAARRIVRLTEDDVWYGDPQWSPDGMFVVAHANRTADRESARFSINKNFDLWAIDLATRGRRQLTSGPGPDVSPRFSPDGKALAYLSVPRKGSHRDMFNLAVVTLGEGEPRTAISFDHHGPNAEPAKRPAPAFPLPDDCWDGPGHLVYNAEVGTATVAFRVDVATGAGEVWTPAKDEEAGLDTLQGRAARKQRLSPPANVFLQERTLAESRVVRWNNEGHELEGVFTTPPAEAAKPPYRLVLFPHGGPHSRSAIGFDFTVQVFAAHGYAVFQPNFRGSAGYGQKFIDADRNDFGGGDMRDILTGIDSLVKEKLVDPDRQFVYGVSYGGYMTCWLAGHTRQFRAAVAQNAVTDLSVMWGLSDIQSWTEWEFGGRPWEVPAAMRKHSPITYAGDIRTPTLVLHAREDRRCPLAMGQMFYQSLLAQQVPSQMVIYPGEGHGIRQPRHREDVLRRTLAWFEQHGK